MKLSALRRLDAYARAEDHLTTQTLSGAVVSVAGMALMAILFVAEVMAFAAPVLSHEMAVDSTRGEKLPIHLNLTFPSLPCSMLSLDALDMSGKHEVDIDTTLYKTKLDARGRAISSERVSNLTDGAHKMREDKAGEEGTEEKQEGQKAAKVEVVQPHPLMVGGFNAMRSVDRVQQLTQALQNGEGCNIAGYLEVERVSGNFHVSTHSHSFHVLEAVLQNNHASLNVSHTVHSLSFGPPFPGVVNPLDNNERMLSKEEAGTFRYFLKVVPTVYSSLAGPEIPTNQFSVTEYFTPSKGKDGALPAVYFMYDLFPITVEIKERRRSVGHFLTRVCAVVGGVFAVSGMLDRGVHALVTRLHPKR